MLGDVPSGAYPYAVVSAHMLEKLDQPDRLARSANEPIVQRHAHDLGALGPFFIEKIEAIDQILREFVGGAEAGVAIKPVIIGFERIGDDQVIPVAGFDPEGQFVAESVAVVKEAALVDQQPASVDAGTAAEPSHWPRAG